LIHSGPRAVTDGDLRLREVTLADAADLYCWRMAPGTRSHFRHADPVPYADHQAYLARYFQAGNTDRWFVVEVRGEPVGTLALYGFSADGTTAEWGRFVIAPEHRGYGWGRRSLALLMDHARAIGVRHLRCEVLDGNDAAEGLYRRLGFAETGAYEQGGRRFLQLAVRLTEET
jgi:RimJ/RimL family protein N-acetyltransferase